MKIVAYHGTDLDIALKIVKEGFKNKKNMEHWLGNGIYLYKDYSLAKWWTTKPTNKFGTSIRRPAVIKCEIEFDRDRVLDLLTLEDYIHFSDIFEKEFKPLLEKNEIVNDPTWQQMRCAYCDFLKKTRQLDIIIGNFYKPDQPYLPAKHNNQFDDFLLQYTEVQICVFEKNTIKDMYIEEIK